LRIPPKAAPGLAPRVGRQAGQGELESAERRDKVHRQIGILAERHGDVFRDRQRGEERSVLK
jgi:hypothetical protein